MKRLTFTILLVTVCFLAGCQPDDTSGDNNGGWIDAAVDGSDEDTAEDSGDDTGGADWSACTVPSDCVLESNSCCDVCGRPELDDMDAVNEDRTQEHFEDVCPEPQPCPDCPTAVNPYLVTTCQSQTCAGFDVREESFTACTTDDDCRLRVRECCECGGTTDPYLLIAIANDGQQAYRDLVCEPNTGCPECAPVYPDNASAFCNDAGHCEVEVSP